MVASDGGMPKTVKLPANNGALNADLVADPDEATASSSFRASAIKYAGSHRVHVLLTHCCHAQLMRVYWPGRTWLPVAHPSSHT